MRVLLVNMNQEINQQVIQQLEQQEAWQIIPMTDGEKARKYLQTCQVDVVVLHACLPRVDGFELIKGLWDHCPLSPPRILFLCQVEIARRIKDKVDCVAHLYTTPNQLCALIQIISKKPLPSLEVVHRLQIMQTTRALLDALPLRKNLKGYAYASWLLCRLVASPVARQQPMGVLYASCASAFHTSAGAVERCLRVAVESVFTEGSLQNIDRVFGATVDPERGKPTNRAFLCQTTAQLCRQLILILQ